MSIERVRDYFGKYGMEERIQEFDVSSATVELAGHVLLIVAAGDARIDNHKYKEEFGAKAKMLSMDEAERFIGHAVGGVCPFAVNEGVDVYLDISLKRFATVFPACGSSNSAIELSIPELEEHSGYVKWVDVCKGY